MTEANEINRLKAELAEARKFVPEWVTLNEDWSNYGIDRLVKHFSFRKADRKDAYYFVGWFEVEDGEIVLFCKHGSGMVTRFTRDTRLLEDYTLQYLSRNPAEQQS